jgi:murein DD-endopeptidase MepM/ murein hydrolase activator NlpD
LSKPYQSSFNRDYKDLPLAPQLLRAQNSGLARVRKHHWLAAASLLAFIAWLATSSTASVNSSFDPQEEAAVSSVATPMPALQVEPGEWISHTIKRNETLGIIFEKYGFDANAPLEVTGLEAGERLKNIRVGKQLRFHLTDKDELDQISYPIDALTDFKVQISIPNPLNVDNADNLGNAEDANSAEISEQTPKYLFSEQTKPYETEEVYVAGSINSSLYEAAEQSGVPIPIIMQMVDVFGWDIDFAVALRDGDSFKLIYEEFNLAGERLDNGNIVAAQFINRGEIYQAFHFTDSEGNANYYTPEGESMRGTFLRTPVEFGRISSRFSKNRFHPILKKWRSHKGVDYAASKGTPIRATADGTIKQVGNNGGYGKTVIISHAGRFSTLYAHMSGYKKGVRSGSSIKQGETIGYVGSTGLATGPHLHYEFRVDDTHRDPLSYKFPKASPVPENDRQAFESLVSIVSAKLEAPDSNQLVMVDNDIK